jgi:hypothetical protein
MYFQGACIHRQERYDLHPHGVYPKQIKISHPSWGIIYIHKYYIYIHKYYYKNQDSNELTQTISPSSETREK